MTMTMMMTMMMTMTMMMMMMMTVMMMTMMMMTMMMMIMVMMTMMMMMMMMGNLMEGWKDGHTEGWMVMGVWRKGDRGMDGEMGSGGERCMNREGRVGESKQDDDHNWFTVAIMLVYGRKRNILEVCKPACR